MSGNHQKAVRLSRERAVSAPSSGAGSGSPSPRKDINAKAMITFETSKAAATINEGTTPGSEYFKTSLAGLA
jgi:hypothetical protein